jgi:hypothetical protein
MAAPEGNRFVGRFSQRACFSARYASSQYDDSEYAVVPTPVGMFRNRFE